MGRPIRNDYTSITAGRHGYRLANTRCANQAPNRSRFALPYPLAQVLGGTPTTRWNARLKEASDL